MNNFVRKFSSRKLWVAIIGVVVGVAAAFGINSNEWAQIAGIVTSCASIISYIFGESKIDAASASARIVFPEDEIFIDDIGLEDDVEE